MNADPASNNPAALSYLGMRKAVGILALALPPALIGGAILLAPLGPTGTWPHPLFQGSISDYYYTPMGNFLVGSLCAIAMFLMSSRGYDWQDELAGYLACAFALGVAFCPTTPPDSPNPTALQNALGNAHEIFAAAMFVVLAYFCLVLFRKTGGKGRPTSRKLLRNRVYSICGWTIVGCMVTMISLHIPAFARLVEHIDMLLIFESIALEAFGIAWLTKGEAILKDEKSAAPASAAKMKKA
jgi:hypothetical protein